MLPHSIDTASMKQQHGTYILVHMVHMYKRSIAGSGSLALLLLFADADAAGCLCTNYQYTSLTAPHT